MGGIAVARLLSLVSIYACIAGCGAGDVEPDDLPKDTDGGYGDTANSGEPNPSECWAEDAPADAVRWQCEGLAQATVRFTLDVEVPDAVPNSEFIQQIIDSGRLDWNELFGPWGNEAYDDPGIDACCAPDIGSDDEDEGEGADGTGTGGSGDEPSEEDVLPQAGVACGHDCADQACRQIPKILRDAAAEVPAGLPLIGPSYRTQLRDLANWVATNHSECWHSMTADGVHESLGAYVLGGEWQIPNSDDWPALTDLSVDGECKVFDWVLPEQGEPHACTGISDNNDEDPFGHGGSSLGGFDTFAPVGGQMVLDGPMIFGTHAAGAAPLLGLGDACPRGECSRIDAWITPEYLELQRMVLMTPQSMTWAQDGVELVVEGLTGMVEHPMSIPLTSDGDVSRFEIPAGELEVLFAGRVHDVPVKVVVPNTTAVTGVVIPLFDGSHGVVIDPFDVEHRDGYGTWTLHMEVGEWVALEHSPRAAFTVYEPGLTPWVDGMTSFDPDGDPLQFEWFLDGAAGRG